MIRTAKLLLLFLATAVTAWVLPWLYHFVTDSSQKSPFTMYSCVIGEFASIDYTEEHGIRYCDATGRRYSDREFDSILPLFYYRQLLTDGRLPDTICGVAVTPREIGLHNFIFRKAPGDLNKTKPELYPLLEAMSGRVDLTMPEDVFRLNHRIEFIDMESNTVNEEKSERFTRALSAKGFEFPARYAEGNPTTHKEYDEGYFLLDNRGELYHLKQLRGRPYIRLIEHPEGIPIGDIFITEFSDRSFYALLSDTEGGLHVLVNPGYELKKLPIGAFFPRQDDITIIGDMFHWTIRTTKPDGQHFYAVDVRNNTLVDTLIYPAEETIGERVGRWFFPFELKFTSYDDSYVYPRLIELSLKTLLLNLALAVVWLLLCRHRHSYITSSIFWSALGILPFGLFLFVPLLMARQ